MGSKAPLSLKGLRPKRLDKKGGDELEEHHDGEVLRWADLEAE